MLYTLLALVTVLVPTVCGRREDDFNVTIVPLGLLTHVVYLSSPAGYCSGSIISEQFVLTAAHCLVTITASKIFGRYHTYSMLTVKHDAVIVKAGVIDMMPTDVQHRQERLSEEIYIHPRFLPMRLAAFDVGLVKVSPPFNFTDVVFRVEISEKGWPVNDTSGETCQASGFGDMTDSLKAQLKLWDVRALHGANTCPCAKRFQWKRLICTSMEGQPARLCNGDSGAGLICFDKVVAVSHMVRDQSTCNNLEYPRCSRQTLNTYTFLCPLNDWIRKHVPLAPPTPKSCLAPRTPLSEYFVNTLLCLFFMYII